MNGTIGVFVYKSERSNAKCEGKFFYIQNNPNPDYFINKIIDILSYIVNASMNKMSGFLNIHFTISATTNHDDILQLEIPRVTYSNIETLVHSLFDACMVIDSVDISRREVKHNPSIEYYISKYQTYIQAKNND